MAGRATSARGPRRGAPQAPGPSRGATGRARAPSPETPLSEVTTATGGSRAVREAGWVASPSPVKVTGPQPQDDDSGFCSEPPEAFPAALLAASPRSVSATSALPAVATFLEWAGPHWGHIFNAFKDQVKHESFVDGCATKPSMRRVDFKTMVSNLGFRGDAGAVFDAVVSHRSPDAHALGGLRRQECMLHVDLKLYKDRHAPRTSENDAVNQLVAALRKRRRTALHAWKLDLDRHGTGKVGFNDFAAACREYHINDGKSIWKTLCPNGGPLSFHDLAPEEAENVEALVEAAGNDLSRAWDVIDIHQSHSITTDEFQRGAQKLGFEGDCRAIYDGSIITHTSRLTRVDFVYLGKLGLGVGRASRRGPQLGAGADLVAWVRRECGGAFNFVAQLGLTASGKETMSTEDFEAHLIAFGYPFDVRQAVAAVAPGAAPVVSGPSLLASFKGRAQASARERSVDVKPRATQRRPASATAGRQQAIRPGWNTTVDLTTRANAKLPSNCRTYFSDPSDRTVREEMKARALKDTQVVVCAASTGRNLRSADSKVFQDHAVYGFSR